MLVVGAQQDHPNKVKQRNLMNYSWILHICQFFPIGSNNVWNVTSEYIILMFSVTASFPLVMDESGHLSHTDRYQIEQNTYIEWNKLLSYSPCINEIVGRRHYVRSQSYHSRFKAANQYALLACYFTWTPVWFHYTTTHQIWYTQLPL